MQRWYLKQNIQEKCFNDLKKYTGEIKHVNPELPSYRESMVIHEACHKFMNVSLP
jgi:hypothetical protein